MSGIGHNGGPTMERGFAWRRHAWTRARAALLPKLPLEVVRIRVTRAAELGLDYRTYAGVRASTGRDLVAFLFSSNALRVDPVTCGIALDRAARLGGLRADRLALCQPPLDPAVVLARNATLDRSGAAPTLRDGWGATRERVRAVLAGLPRDGVLVIGDTALERDWSLAGGLAGYLPAARYFT